MKTGWIFLFWGTMDLFYIARFCYLGFSNGRIPFYSDIQSLVPLSVEHGLVAVLFLLFGLILNISMFFSVYLFFRGSSQAPCLAYAQIPLRLILVVPSLSFVLWFSKSVGVTSAVLMITLLLLSEMLKFLSIFFRGRLRFS
ncbi:hypothetical protein BK665_16790 [Pseudomonas frederiksbergensis]|uniref:Arginine:ornithine antiporter n=1 Tax=Pseudomonas frederiksbergensis TaxID=104087 RepID=A0A423KFC2_9PSED|nr:hypothetical protein BK665_16790 [Pseudomonas frederiksbergensis]